MNLPSSPAPRNQRTDIEWPADLRPPSARVRRDHPIIAPSPRASFTPALRRHQPDDLRAVQRWRQTDVPTHGQPDLRPRAGMDVHPRRLGLDVPGDRAAEPAPTGQRLSRRSRSTDARDRCWNEYREMREERSIKPGWS